VCIGGDGSLTGANLFRQEWSSLLEELVSTGASSQLINAKPVIVFPDFIHFASTVVAVVSSQLHAFFHIVK